MIQFTGLDKVVLDPTFTLESHHRCGFYITQITLWSLSSFFFWTSSQRYSGRRVVKSPKSYLCQVRGIKISSRQLHTFSRKKRSVRKIQNIQEDTVSRTSSGQAIRTRFTTRSPLHTRSNNSRTLWSTFPTQSRTSIIQAFLSIYTPTYKQKIKHDADRFL